MKTINYKFNSYKIKVSGYKNMFGETVNVVTSWFIHDDPAHKGKSALVWRIESPESIDYLIERMQDYLDHPQFDVCDNCGLPLYCHYRVVSQGGSDIRCNILPDHITSYDQFMADDYVPF